MPSEVGRSNSLDTHLTGSVAAINISNGGVPKRRVSGAQVSRLGLEKDTQDDKKHHRQRRRIGGVLKREGDFVDVIEKQ